MTFTIQGFPGFGYEWERFARQNFYGTIKRQLVEDKDEFGKLLVTLVRQNTPVLTSALYESVDYQPDPDDGDNGIVRVFANPLIQMAEWNRVYDVYQEGGELGKPTYTNAPHEMFAKALAQVDTIVNLAEKAANSSLNRLANNLGDY